MRSGERRRPDSVAFVPLQYWRFKWIAIELDGGHSEAQGSDDKARAKDLEEHKYEVIPIRRSDKNYFLEVRTLVEKIEGWMQLGENEPWEVGFDAQVLRIEEDDDIPF